MNKNWADMSTQVTFIQNWIMVPNIRPQLTNKMTASGKFFVFDHGFEVSISGGLLLQILEHPDVHQF